jgi:hypothetical protein
MIDQFLHFRSGTNHSAEIRGTFRAGFNVGVSAPELYAPALEELERHGEDCKGKRLCFVDTGAFGQVDRELRIVKPTTEAQWKEIHRRQIAVANAWGRGSFHVAPDMPGHQDATLELLQRYGEQMFLLTQLGANVIVPLVPGPMPMDDFAAAAVEALGFNALELVWGIPCRKNATDPKALAVFAAQLRDAGHPLPRFHLLGIAPAPWNEPDAAAGKYLPGAWPGEAFMRYFLAIRYQMSYAHVGCDSVRIVALKGTKSGRGGGPRALTRAEQECIAEGMTTADQIKEESIRRVYAAEQLRRTRFIIGGERAVKALVKSQKAKRNDKQATLFEE